MEALLQADDCRVQGFLAAGHVCTVAGYESYVEFVKRYQVPVVVTGFEPVDLLTGILECVEQLESGRCEVANCYRRSVQRAGNSTAQEIVARVFEPADRPWRGMGTIPGGGFQLRPEWARFDAREKFGEAAGAARAPCADCRSGDVLAGRIRPPECPSFGTRCTPDTPLGAPMVSSEGACAAYFRYRPPAPAREPQPAGGTR
jgi:hydrogenase expression/formation protein HypD